MDCNHQFHVLFSYQGNLLRGIDNCSGAAQSVVQVRVRRPWTTVLVSNVSLFQLKSLKEVTKKVDHGKKNQQNAKTNLSNCPIQL